MPEIELIQKDLPKLVEDDEILEEQNKAITSCRLTTIEKKFGDQLDNVKMNLNELWNGKSVFSLPRIDSSAIAIGAGHSLTEDKIKLLKDYKGTLFCCDRAFSMLIEEDIIPDFVVCLESNLHPNYEFLIGKGLNKFHKKVKGLFIACTHPKILKDWKGEKYFFGGIVPHDVYNGNEFLKILLKPPMKEEFVEIPLLWSGGNVGSSSWYLASVLGANPIGLLGLDFSERMPKNLEMQSWGLFLVYADLLLQAIKDQEETIKTITINCTDYKENDGHMLKCPWLKEMKLKEFVGRYE
jgi:hypothetical protein